MSLPEALILILRIVMILTTTILVITVTIIIVAGIPGVGLRYETDQMHDDLGRFINRVCRRIRATPHRTAVRLRALGKRVPGRGQRSWNRHTQSSFYAPNLVSITAEHRTIEETHRLDEVIDQFINQRGDSEETVTQLFHRLTAEERQREEEQLDITTLQIARGEDPTQMLPTITDRNPSSHVHA